jgi:hypothetical protein
VSPGWIVTDEGEKKNPPSPTSTVTVAALATVRWKASSGTIVTINVAMRSENVFIG